MSKIYFKNFIFVILVLVLFAIIIVQSTFIYYLYQTVKQTEKQNQATKEIYSQQLDEYRNQRDQLKNALEILKKSR